MTNLGSIVAAYAVVFFGVVGYIGWLLARGRVLSKRVPGERRRWINS